jgi:hypothetical protein
MNGWVEVKVFLWIACSNQKNSTAYSNLETVLNQSCFLGASVYSNLGLGCESSSARSYHQRHRDL